MKRLFLFSLLVVHSFVVFAQTDSAAVVDANWQKERLAKGVIFKAVHFKDNQLFNSNQYLTIVEIRRRANRSKLAIAYSDSLEKTSAIAKNRNALAGINGSFFKMRGPDPDHQKDLTGVPRLEPANIGRNRSVVYLRVRDSLIAEHVFSRDSLRRRHQQGAITISNGKLSILTTAATNLQWERELIADDIIATGPVMLLDGRDLPVPNDAFCNNRHPRTAVGKKHDGTVVLLVVDGRLKEAAGMSIPELQKTMRWLGCTDAINFDGGGSSTMYIKGKPADGVVNHPSDNKKFDHLGEREVANALLLLPK